jgi:hypothetical protein
MDKLRGRQHGRTRNIERDESAVRTGNGAEELIPDSQARTIADVVVNNAAVRAERSASGFGDVSGGPR